MTERAPAAPWHKRVMNELADQGKTRMWLHQRSGVARNTIDNWAKQPRPPQAGTVIAVAEALGIDPTEALTLAGIPNAGAAAITATRLDLADVDTDALLAEIRRRIPD